MGSNECCCEMPIRNVTISGFYVGRHQVTQGSGTM